VLFDFVVPASTFTDPDGDSLSITVTRQDGSALPSWLQFAAGKLTGTPDFADAGTLQLRVSASDGKGGAASVDFTVMIEQAAAIPLRGQSYRNFKEVGLAPSPMPSEVVNALARAYGDFAGNRRLNLFTADIGRTYGSRQPAEYTFWRKLKDGSFQKMPAIANPERACLFPRKALVADFNLDSRPDVFVSCHGLDQAPFPGERNNVVLSRSDGSYAIDYASTDVAFFHGSAAADMTGDGYPDVVSVNCPKVGAAGVFTATCLLRNRGDGTFVRDDTWKRPVTAEGGYVTIEIVDIDEDGDFDIIQGGDFTVPAVVILNPGNGDFTSVRPTVVPTVAADENVLDFLVTGTGASRTLWVLRTGGEAPDGGPNYYRGRTLQRVRWPSLQSDVPYRVRSEQWVPWIIESGPAGGRVISTDRTADQLNVTSN
jgi:hypothetical protein